MRKIVITGGHLTPALAVIEMLKKKGGWEILFVGRKYAIEEKKALSMEEEMVVEKKVAFYALDAGKLPKKFNRFSFLALFKVPLGFWQAFWLLKKLRPDVVLSFGGYLSVPVVFAGWLLQIPAITHEQTTTIGLASRLNSHLVEKIAISWPETAQFLPKEKVVLTGNPLRSEFFCGQEKTWKILKFDPRRPTIFITGGNIGSRVINQTVAQTLDQLLAKYNLFHQCGHAAEDYEALLAKERSMLSEKAKCYHLKKYLNSQEMAAIMKGASLIIARAGANTVTEIAYLGKPALFIPIPWSRANEQTKNAQMLVKTGTAKILSQDKLTPQTLLKEINQMMDELSQYKKKASQAQKLVRVDAAERIVALVESL